jgi:hypothetical protein
MQELKSFGEASLAERSPPKSRRDSLRRRQSPQVSAQTALIEVSGYIRFPPGAILPPIVRLPAFHLRAQCTERPWRAVQHDLLGTVRRVLLDEYARQNALRPGAVHDPFDFRLTRGETSGAILRVQLDSSQRPPSISIGIFRSFITWHSLAKSCSAQIRSATGHREFKREKLGDHQFLGEAAPKITLRRFHQPSHQIFRHSVDRSILIDFGVD